MGRKERSQQQQIDINGVNLFEGMLRAWAVRQRKPDFRIDYVIEVMDDGIYTGHEFGVQLKSRDGVQAKDGLVSQRVETSHLEYWLERYRSPLLIVTLDITTSTAYWLFIQEYADQGKLSADWKSKSRVTLKIPINQTFEDLQAVRDAVLKAEKFMQLRNPPPMADIAQSNEQKYERLDPRFRISFNFLGGKSVYVIAPKEQVELTVKPTTEIAKQRWEDAVGRGLPTTFEKGDLRVEGSPLFDSILSNAMTLTNDSGVPIEVRFSARNCEDKSVVALDPFPGIIEGGPLELRVRTTNNRVPLQFSSTIVQAKLSRTVRFNFNVRLWGGLPVRDLPYFHQIRRFMDGVAAGKDIHVECLKDGQVGMAVTIPRADIAPQVIENFHGAMQFISMIRQLAERFKVNPNFPVEPDEKMMESIEPLHGMIFGMPIPQPGKGKWIGMTLKPVSDFFLRPTADKMLDDAYLEMRPDVPFNLCGLEIRPGSLGLHLRGFKLATPINEVQRQLAEKRDDGIAVEWVGEDQSQYWLGPPLPGERG